MAGLIITAGLRIAGSNKKLQNRVQKFASLFSNRHNLIFITNGINIIVLQQQMFLEAFDNQFVWFRDDLSPSLDSPNPKSS